MGTVDIMRRVGKFHLMPTDQTNPSEEWLPVVDSDDNVLGREGRGVIHARGLCHRAVHILVFNSGGELYLQRRSWIKDSAPGKWDSSASGHVDWGEAYEEAAVRELKEELGLECRDPIKQVCRLAACPETGMEFTEVYTVLTDAQPVPDPVEILEGQWISQDRLDAWVKNRPDEFARCFLAVWSSVRNGRPGGEMDEYHEGWGCN